MHDFLFRFTTEIAVPKPLYDFWSHHRLDDGHVLSDWVHIII